MRANNLQLRKGETIKHYLVYLCALVLLNVVWASAQSEHDVSVKLPSLYGIRIVDSADRPALAPSVTFDYGADIAGYDAAVAGAGVVEASSVTDFGDVQVFVRKKAGDFNPWVLQVQATPFIYSGGVAGPGLALSDISVERGLTSGLTQEAVTFGVVQPRWSLSGSSQLIAFSAYGTMGWQSLGFNGSDYRVKVDGDEDPGEYTTTVTYTIVEP